MPLLIEIQNRTINLLINVCETLLLHNILLVMTIIGVLITYLIICICTADDNNILFKLFSSTQYVN